MKMDAKVFINQGWEKLLICNNDISRYYSFEQIGKIYAVKFCPYQHLLSSIVCFLTIILLDNVNLILFTRKTCQVIRLLKSQWRLTLQIFEIFSRRRLTRNLKKKIISLLVVVSIRYQYLKRFFKVCLFAPTHM